MSEMDKTEAENPISITIPANTTVSIFGIVLHDLLSLLVGSIFNCIVNSLCIITVLLISQL